MRPPINSPFQKSGYNALEARYKGPQEEFRTHRKMTARKDIKNAVAMLVNNRLGECSRRGRYQADDAWSIKDCEKAGRF